MPPTLTSNSRSRSRGRTDVRPAQWNTAVDSLQRAADRPPVQHVALDALAVELAIGSSLARQHRQAQLVAAREQARQCEPMNPVAPVTSVCSRQPTPRALPVEPSKWRWQSMQRTASGTLRGARRDLAAAVLQVP